MPPDHGAAAGAPLYVQDLPVGTISVRITRPSMTEPIAGADVVGTWTTKSGGHGSATVKTGADGRAIFSEVPAGATFGAKAEIEGENLATAQFPVPAEGGTRLLMIVGGRASEAIAEMTGQPGHGLTGSREPFALRVGKIEPREGLPVGTVEIRVLSADGKPMPGVRVNLALAQRAATYPGQQANTDDSGTARFTKMQTDVPLPGHLVALVEHDGLRVGSHPFDLDAKRGAAGELRIPGKTSNLSVLRVSASTRMMVEPREDSIAFLQNLVIENASDKVFDPGPAGLLIPLPDGCTGAETMSGGAEVEIKEGAGVILRGLLRPTDNPAAVAQVRVGCVLKTHETPEVEIVQPMPLGMQGGLVMIPATLSIGLSAPGLRGRPIERDDSGNELRMYDLASVARGTALRLTVVGLPTRGQAGKWIAAVLACLIVVAGIVTARKPRRTIPAGEG
jgi:hypothetical protein